MKSLRHRLPSLTSLMAFEAAARALNFSRAAEELHVSQAAISKQIRQLEESLGVELFERNGRRVTLSPRGKQLHAKVSTSFNYLADAVEEICARDQWQPITLAANTATAHYWLSEVMRDFREHHPHFSASIRMITSDHTSDLFDDNVDLAIVYDPVQHENWSSQLLFEEELFPVASPDYIRENPLEHDGPEALFKHNLLDYERLEPNWINWKAWFSAQGIDARQIKPTEYGNNYIVLVDAATRGRGVTIGTRYLLDQELRSERLARLSSLTVRSGRGYYLMSNLGRPYRDEVNQLRAWLDQYSQPSAGEQPARSLT
ncbi:LysR substrate-binding domain-containing protein [Pseudomonas citri]|uniref:LysR substrate-binding domain-containing protein n=1 Tax=Pseudomonas citri TaxID=2978349 RepID=UPI0021B5FF98|nr:LysR substrate-binding domain-containing protein [Pseudomonas citri]